jgi:hypothetical protein
MGNIPFSSMFRLYLTKRKSKGPGAHANTLNISLSPRKYALPYVLVSDRAQMG